MRSSANVLNVLGHRLLISGPTRGRAERRLLEHGLDAADPALLNLEEFAQLPRPVDVVMIEEGEGEDDAALAVHGDEAAVANAAHDALEALLELLLAAHAIGRRGVLGAGRDHTVLMAQTIVGERIVALAVIGSHASEVVVGGTDQIRAAHPLGRRDHLSKDRVRRTVRLDRLAGRWKTWGRRRRGSAELHVGTNRKLLDLGDLALTNLQAQDEADGGRFGRSLRRGAAGDLHGAEEGDLLGL